MNEERVDLLTIGAGGGAYPAAFRLASAGYSVVMVDPKGVLSGNCLYEGCVPSKTIREMVQMAESQQRFAGSCFRGTSLADYRGIITHKDAVQSRRYDQHMREMQELDGLRLLKGTAKLKAPHQVDVETDAGLLTFHCRYLIIASGCDIFVPQFPGSGLCLTSHDIYKPDPDLKELPARMAIIGGGYIGLETASIFAALGTEVTLLQKGPQLLTGADPGLVARLIPLLNPRIKVITGATVLGIQKTDSDYMVCYTKDDETQDIDTDVVLLAAGRRPCVPEGCAEIGIELGPKGIIVDESLQTAAHKHIYACGDVNGHVPLFHAAVRQSLVAAHNILAKGHCVDYADFRTVPTTVFTIPAAAYVGITPVKAAAKGIKILTARYEFAEDSRAQILEQIEGGIELFFEPGSLILLGGWVVGIDAGLLIGEIGIATAKHLTAYDLAKFSDQHPMSSEGISKAARALF